MASCVLAPDWPHPYLSAIRQARLTLSFTLLRPSFVFVCSKTLGLMDNAKWQRTVPSSRKERQARFSPTTDITIAISGSPVLLINGLRSAPRHTTGSVQSLVGDSMPWFLHNNSNSSSNSINQNWHRLNKKKSANWRAGLLAHFFGGATRHIVHKKKKEFPSFFRFLSGSMDQSSSNSNWRYLYIIHVTHLRRCQRWWPRDRVWPTESGSAAAASGISSSIHRRINSHNGRKKEEDATQWRRTTTTTTTREREKNNTVYIKKNIWKKKRERENLLFTNARQALYIYVVH